MNNYKIGGLMIGINVDIIRSDGRIHSAVISSINAELNIITVEWFEKGEAKGKEVEFEEVFQINPLLAPIAKKNEITQMLSKPSRIKEEDLETNRRTNEVKKKPANRSQRRLTCVDEIEKIRIKREERRTNMCHAIYSEIDSSNPNFDYYRMINEYRTNNKIGKPVYTEEACLKKIMVCVRIRPMNKKEFNKHDIDVITVPTKTTLVVHEPKMKVDMTKYIENQNFRFDYVFDENCDNGRIYEYTTKPLVESIFEGGMATCFAYGQTGSGKTYTMCGEFSMLCNHDNEIKGIYFLAARDIFKLKETKYMDYNLDVEVSFFEIYGGKIYDLLNERQRLSILEDNKSQIQLLGLKCQPVENVGNVLDFLKIGAFIRSKGQTSQNEKSSRSHAIFQILLKHKKSRKVIGKLSLIDLAGNERGADTVSSKRDVRFEGAEINKSLLVLKECIRALGRKGAHLPFRGSKLTLVLRDSFINDQSQICMIALMSPNFSSCENTLNTLRYADRVKELCTDSQGSCEIYEKEFESCIKEFNDTTSQSKIKYVNDEIILSHRELIQEHIPSWIKKYSMLLNKTKNVDYDIEDYSRNLEEVVNSDIKILSNIRENLKSILSNNEYK